MTEPSQYFKGRTVQEQMNEVIGYVDVRAEEVAAAKADDVLEPAEAAKVAAQAAQSAAETAKAGAEAARDTTLAALPAVNERIDDVESELNAVTLRVTTAEGDIVTIQGRITAVENKNTQQDSAIAGLVAADAQNVKITNINQYALGLTGNQTASGVKNINNNFSYGRRLTGTTIFEIARFNIVSDVQVYYLVYTRASAGLGKVTITNDGSSTSMTHQFIKTSGEDTFTTFFSYIEDDKIVLCIGNAASTNNYVSLNICSAMYGAGLQLPLDISQTGVQRSPATSSNIGVLY